ncbi:DNA phosphorothioation-dependent restriction protein DptH [Anaerobacterium chartisolvens]|nr:DNA phosphorothioation-dependent restriction protein DptH [Anaerobacterium chartisolvens]
MSKQFYNYLAKKIVDYFSSRQISNGDKFGIRFEKEEQVKALYDELAYTPGIEAFIYPANNPVYETYSLIINGIKIIVAATIDGIKADFLTRLRNKVGTIEESEFIGTAILFIHNTDLDSLVRGSESFYKESMPFHSKNIVDNIKEKIICSSLSKVDKNIINVILERKASESFQDHTSIFDYEEILEVLNSTGIEKEQYKNFGLFYDSELTNYGEKDIKERLKDNYQFYAIVDASHKYGNPEVDLERYFDQKGLEILCDKDWRDIVEYKDVKLSATNKKNTQPIKYIENHKDTSMVGIPYWERPEGESKARSRIRNIIIFNKDAIQDIEIEFSFDKFVTNSNLKVENKSEASAVASGKKIRVYINHIIGSTGFSKINYKDDSIKYEFRIATVECGESILEGIKTNYSINFKDKTIVTRLNENVLVIRPGGVSEIEEVLEKVDNTIEIFDDNQTVKLIRNIGQINDESEYIDINLKYINTIIPIAIHEESIKPILVTGVSVWKLKRELQESFIYKGENKLIQGTREYFAKEEYKKNIEKEKNIIESEGLFYFETYDGLIAEEITIDAQMEDSYRNLVRYYKSKNLLPSLTFMDDTLLDLSTQYVQQYLDLINDVENGQTLTTEQINLMKLGTIYRTVEEKEILLTPLHPLNVAYQVVLNQTIGNEEVSEEILNKLGPNNLLPYIYREKDKLYKAIEQSHSPEWNYYVSDKMLRYKGSRDFVSKLVREKIDEFIEHFSYLFTITKDCAIKINLINLGDCKEIIQGIFEFYIKQLKKNSNAEDLINIQLYIYGDDKSHNAFEEISFYQDTQLIKDEFSINLSLEDFSEEEVLGIFRNKVRFYMKDVSSLQYEYCHIAFYQLEQFHNPTYSNMSELSTGISMKGLMSGIPSVYSNNFYRTGFGTKFINEDNLLIDVAKKINAIARTAGGLYPFNNNESINTAISDESRKTLDKIYDSSNWVTFIDPKVDLNFFKNDPMAKDILIIHYSDQYSSSSGYDAITVTRKSKQYQVIIEEYLKSKMIHDVEKSSPKLINVFNAVNGDWLLRLISNNRQFPREKLSILSAIKIGLAYLYNENIIWIPISLEEILRVSGGTGLKSSDGLFSAKNLGAPGSYCDDLMFVGIENIEHRIKVYFYPIEVKIGKNDANVISKAKEQIKQTRALFFNNLIEMAEEEGVDNRKFTKRIYRNFLAQLAIVSAEKMKLYEVWPEQNWDLIVDTEVRAKLLNDNYEISCDLDSIIGHGAIISFKKDVYFKSVIKQDDILQFEFSEDDGYQYTVKNTEELKDSYINGESDINKDNLLHYVYHKCEYGIERGDNHSLVADKSQEEAVTQSKEIEQAEIVEAVPMNIKFGQNSENKSPVLWYPTSTDKTMHTNTGIIGTMGTGKTQFTKSLIAQLHWNSKDNVNGTKIGILIFDYKGDYIKEDFKKVTNAKVYNLYHLPYNPLALYQSGDFKPLLPLHTANSIKDTISTAFHLGPIQQATLKDVIMEAYETRGIRKADSSTWGASAPTLHDVYRIYSEKENIKTDSLYSALNALYEFEIFEPDHSKTKTLFDVIDGVTVINLSGYDKSIQNLVVAITLDVFYSQMQMGGHSAIKGNYREITKMILVDEADNFLSEDFQSLKKILKEGREFGVGSILSTQLLSHFSTTDNEYANYILTWVVHNVTDISNKDVRYIFNTQSKTEEENIFNKIKNLEKHYSIVKLGGGINPIHMKDKAFWELTQEFV